MPRLIPATAVALLASTALASGALAAPPAVVTDIAPIHSLVAMVMGDIGAPTLFLDPGADGHDTALRPSDAGRIAAAGLIVWVGPELSPWLTEPLDTLAPDVPRLTLFQTPGWEALPAREAFGHDHGDEDHAEEGHDDHADEHNHGDEHDHADEHNHGDGHDHGDGPDPHAWLDPDIAALWVAEIATALSTLDPDNAAAYAANATAAATTLRALGAEVDAALTPVAGRPFVVAHDAYHYIEHRTGAEAMAAITLGDAADPGPAHVAQVMATLAQTNAACILADSHTSPDWIDLVRDGRAVTIVQADPSGTGLPLGPDLYPAMIRAIAMGLSTCLAQG